MYIEYTMKVLLLEERRREGDKEVAQKRKHILRWWIIYPLEL